MQIWLHRLTIQLTYVHKSGKYRRFFFVSLFQELSSTEVSFSRFRLQVFLPTLKKFGASCECSIIKRYSK